MIRLDAELRRVAVVVVTAPRPDTPHAVAWMAAALPGAERDRARSLHGYRRAEFIGGRVLLRGLLAQVLRCPPVAVPIMLTESGRPEVAPTTDLPVVGMSLAHAGGLITVALSRYRDVGVDVEAVRTRPTAVGWCCSPAERAWLAGLSAHQRPTAFARLWTRKEACVKATGTGIRGRLSAIHCGTASSGQWGRVWWRDVPAAPGFAAAVAVDPRTFTPELHHWSS